MSTKYEEWAKRKAGRAGLQAVHVTVHAAKGDHQATRWKKMIEEHKTKRDEHAASALKSSEGNKRFHTTAAQAHTTAINAIKDLLAVRGNPGKYLSKTATPADHAKAIDATEKLALRMSSSAHRFSQSRST